MFEAVEIVQQRQSTICEALESNKIPYALSGSNATYQWIASTDESAVRFYRNVEFIVARHDQAAAIEILSAVGLHARLVDDHFLFRARPTQRDHWCDCALFANEFLAGTKCEVPGLDYIERLNCTNVLPFFALISLQLSRWKLDDRVDLQDMIDVGLLDYSHLKRLQAELAARDNPNN